MSTANATPPIDTGGFLVSAPGAKERAISIAIISLLTVLAFLIHGYHPYAEDGGLYAAGVKFLLEPDLYPSSLAFVEAHLRFSLFAPGVATAVRSTHLNLPIVLLLIHLSSIWITLLAIWILTKRCFQSRFAAAGAAALFAAWLTIPVAGTSLIMMDPYVTARSISLPCSLLALTAVFDFMPPRPFHSRKRSYALCAIALLVASLVHPLMAAYALGHVLLLILALTPNPSVRRWGTIALCAFAVLLAAVLQANAPQEAADYLPVAASRYYWFLSRWQWYEIIGILAPLLILAVFAFYSSHFNGVANTFKAAQRALARMAIASGLTAIFLSLAFAHERQASHIVARLQPLRTFQIVYVVMILFLGASLGERILRQKISHWIAVFAVFGSLLYFVQRSTYPSSTHIEWPGASTRNQWQRAFIWISRNTPRDALFALDADYISAAGEDAQSFRAIAERSALPDYSKDGGEASITPSLTAAWAAGQGAQMHLSSEKDAERLTALRPFNVSWIVLRQHTQTSFDCPYANDTVKVCRLP